MSSTFTDTFKEKIFILAIMTALLLSVSYIFQDYLYIMLVSLILTLSTYSLNLKINKSIISFARKKKIKWLVQKSNFLTTTSLTVILLLFIFTPLIYFIIHSYSTIIPKIDINNLKTILQSTLGYVQNLPEPFNYYQTEINLFLKSFDITSVDMNVVKKTLGITLNFFKNLNSIFMEIFLILLFFFMFNLYGKQIKNYIYSMMPIKNEDKLTLFSEFGNTSAVVLYGTLFSMFAQGIAFGILMMFFSYDAFYLGLMAGFLSVIPIIGGAIIFVPVAILEIIAGNYIGAGIILIYSIIFMGFVIDNVFKIFFINFINKKMNFNYSIHEGLMLLSMIAAIGVIGFWGIIVGPAVTALTLASFKLYKKLVMEIGQ